jgi:hypothetical protein
MKIKIIVLIVSLVFIGCQRYEANVQITKCTDKMDTIHLIYCDHLLIDTRKQAVPVLQDYSGKVHALNVCNFKILSQKELK